METESSMAVLYPSLPLACTNKIEVNARHALKTTGIINFFMVITDSDSTAHPKPHPLPLSHTLKELDIAHEKAVLIGDTHIDARCAAHCNVDFVFAPERLWSAQ